jgi:hypothetical protein
MDFWVGSALLIVLALFEVILFGWIFGAERGLEETNRGSDIRVPRIFVYVIRYVCPAYLTIILGAFAYQNFPDRVRAIAGDAAALVTVAFMVIVMGSLLLSVHIASRRWEQEGRFDKVPRERPGRRS